MNLSEFMSLYEHLGQKKKVIVKCQCGNENEIVREKALENIKNHEGEYVCRPCSMKISHLKKPRGEETRFKQSVAKKGKKASDTTKALMSQSKIDFYKTSRGEEVKKELSKKTSNVSSKLDKSKRKVLYVSAKNNGDIRVCFSSYEFVACEDFLEANPDIVKYETQVPYQVGERWRSLDFLIEYKDGTKKVVEVKPSKRITEDYQIKQIIDSRENAEKNNWQFEVWTEKELKIQKSKDATKRADDYKKKHYLLDYDSYRKSRIRIKSKKHYDNKIATDKVVVYCDYCCIYHTPLRKTYEKNILRNTNYICERFGGHLAGSKPKFHLRKENPYASEGKKQCTGKDACNQVLHLTDFSPDNSRRDGYCSVCKECRKKIANKRYAQKKGIKID